MNTQRRHTLLALAVAATLSPAAWAQSMGTPTATNPNASSYLTAEYNNRANNLINANAAYARGWTGRGSTVLIMDTGVNTAHPDLAGKIKYAIDFTGTGLADRVGHGTHLAGVVAAARNGSGTHGVAYDANLAIAKIANSSTLIWRNANYAMAWASQYSDVTVANLSANVNYHKTYTAASRQVAPGLWINTHAEHGGKNYYNLESPNSLVIPRNMAMTVSAGNSTLGYVQNPATFATATDSSGNLVHGGRLLVVGHWNSGRSVIEGATAGHMCKDYRVNTCYDRYRMSDFYILAPGSQVIGAANTGTGTRPMSGTSQSAAVAAGALAVINQMWPYMTPENQIQVLLRTANKNLQGYKLETHGQGLLDLDRATQPIGAVGLTTTGRTGRTQPITAIAISGSTSQAQGRLSSVTVVDELQRDFTANLSSAVTQRTLLRDPLALVHEPGQSWSAKLIGVHSHQFQSYSVGQTAGNVTMSLNNGMWGSNEAGRHQVTLTQAAYNPFVQYSGAWGSVANSTTIEYDYIYRAKSGAWAQAGVASTATVVNPGLVERVGAMQTIHGVIGYSQSGMNVYAGIQPWMVSGALHLRVPGAVDERGVLSYTSSRVSVAAQRPVAYAGINYSHQVDRASRVVFGLAGNETGDYRGGVTFSKHF